MKKFSKTVVLLFSALMMVNVPSFAGSDDVSFGKVLDTINNVFGKTSDETTVVTIGVGEQVESYNQSACEASGNSACQSAAGLGVNQIHAGQNKNVLAVQGTVVKDMKATNISNGSASGGSTNQSSSGGASNQVASY